LSQSLESIVNRIKYIAILICIIISVGIAATSCKGGQDSSQTQTQKYSLKGKVVSIDKQTHEVVVDAEAIPGFMGAMAMPYPVKDVKILDELSPGDEIRGDLVVNAGSPVLESVVVTKKATPGSSGSKP